ncbi:MAG: hypothetical protein DHS20C08_16080 [Rhodomicrobium sp.]|nr:MAG: hypothetical protein DHS20C08_16080 [Rhodomicrobium sp.]
MQTVISIKWGTRYGSDYVNRLYNMVKRNTVNETRFVCFTEDATGVKPGVEIKPLPQINIPDRVSSTPWRKLCLWQDPLEDISGDVLFLDLDLVITGNMDDFFSYEPGRYAVIHNWTQPNLQIGNTSCFRFRVGKHTHIFDEFVKDPEAILRQYRIEQQYISHKIPDQVFWPKEWCVSFKHNLLPPWPQRFFTVPPLPDDTKLVAFTGKPDPEDAVIGKWPEKNFLKKCYKHVRPTPWIAEHWR